MSIVPLENHLPNQSVEFIGFHLGFKGSISLSRCWNPNPNLTCLCLLLSSFSTSSHKRIRVQNSQHTKWIIMDDLVRKMRQMSKPVRVNLGRDHSLPIGIGSKSLSFDSFVLDWLGHLGMIPDRKPYGNFSGKENQPLINDWPLTMMIFHCHVKYCVTLYCSSFMIRLAMGQAISKPFTQK